MRAQQSSDVERMDASKQAVPHHRQDQRRDDQLRKARRRIAGELALLHRALGNPAHQGYAARNDLAMIELRNRWESAGPRQ